MKRAIFYLLIDLVCLIAAGTEIINKNVLFASESVELIVSCGVIGGIGGVTYCLRGIYLNACILDQWSIKWLPWYFIRPLVSIIMGAISCLFLQAGLIVLEASKSNSTSNFAFYAFAFIAGLNVDKFTQRIEEIAETVWGIKKSRVSSGGNDNGGD